jgi:hypothetical protein
VTVGTTSIPFNELNRATDLSQGTGITISGNQVSVDTTVATLTGTQALTNKDLTSGTNTFPTLNQNTTGTSGGITGKTTPTGALVGTTDTQTLTNKDLTAGTNTFPTFNQNTTGSAATLTTTRNIDGQGFNGSADITVIAPGTHAATSKTTPVDADELPLADSAASFALKKLTWANLKATVKAYYDSVTSTLTNKDLTSGTNTFPTFNQNTTGSAATLTTARTIGGVSFNGSANIVPGTATPTASQTATWDANANMAANAFTPNATSVTTAAGTTTLTIASTQVQILTGSSTQTVKLPTTSVGAAATYIINNQSSGAVTVQSSGANTIATQATNTVGVYVSQKATPTAATDWTADIIANGKALTVNNSLTFAGTDGNTITFPSGSDTVVTLGATQTLTAKTLTSPTLTNPTITGYTETVQALGTLGSTATLPAVSSGTMLWGTLTTATACTITMPTAAAGLSFYLALRQPASGTATTATFTGVKWPAAGAPTITATVGKADVLSFSCYDGSNWYGAYVQGYTY